MVILVFQSSDFELEIIGKSCLFFNVLLKNSSWLRVQHKQIFSMRGLKHRATKERGFEEHARKSFPDFNEVDMTNPISFFVEVDILKKYFNIITDVQIIFFAKKLCVLILHLSSAQDHL